MFGPPTHWKDGKYLEKEVRGLEAGVRNGDITYPLEGTQPQSVYVSRLQMAFYGYMKRDGDKLELPPEDSKEWGDILISQYKESSDDWGRATIDYYQTFKHFNIELNEEKMSTQKDVYQWAGVILHEMMHNWGWGHDKNTEDRREYIYKVQAVARNLTPKS